MAAPASSIVVGTEDPWRIWARVDDSESLWTMLGLQPFAACGDEPRQQGRTAGRNRGLHLC